MLKIQGALVWIVVTIFVIYSFCLNTAAGVFADAIKRSLHATNFGASLATGAFILGFACMQIPAGYFLDKWNAKYVVNVGILILAAGNLIISFSKTLTIFTISNFFQGIGASSAFIAAAVLISQWFSPKYFPILFGLTQTLSCICSGILHYYFTIKLSTHPWNALYWQFGVFGLILLGFSLIIVKSPSFYKKKHGLSFKKALFTVIKNKEMLFCGGAAALSFGVLLAYASFWYKPIQMFYHLTEIQAVMISGWIFVGIGIGSPFWGGVSNFVKSRINVARFTLLVGAVILLFGIYFPHSGERVVKIISFLSGFFLAGSMLFYTMMNEISTEDTRGVAISFLNTIVFLFNTFLLFLPYLFVTDLIRDVFTYLWILPFCVLIALLLLSFINDTFSRRV